MYFLFVLFEKKRNQVKLNRELGFSMCIRTGIRDVYQGVQGACPQRAVIRAEGTAERQRAPCRRRSYAHHLYVISRKVLYVINFTGITSLVRHQY